MSRLRRGRPSLRRCERKRKALRAGLASRLAGALLGRRSAAQEHLRLPCLSGEARQLAGTPEQHASPHLPIRRLRPAGNSEPALDWHRQPGTPRLPSEASADAPHEAATGTSCPHLPPRERSHGKRGRARPASRSAWSHRSVACAAKGCLLHPHALPARGMPSSTLPRHSLRSAYARTHAWERLLPCALPLRCPGTGMSGRAAESGSAAAAATRGPEGLEDSMRSLSRARAA